MNLVSLFLLAYYTKFYQKYVLNSIKCFVGIYCSNYSLPFPSI